MKITRLNKITWWLQGSKRTRRSVFEWFYMHLKWYYPLDHTMVKTATHARKNCCKMRPGHQFLYVSASCVSQLLPFQGHLSGCCWPLAVWWQTSGQRQALCFVPSKLANNPHCALVEVPAAKGESPFCSESPGFSCLHCVTKKQNRLEGRLLQFARFLSCSLNTMNKLNKGWRVRTL